MAGMLLLMLASPAAVAVGASAMAARATAAAAIGTSAMAERPIAAAAAVVVAGVLWERSGQATITARIVLMVSVAAAG
jgi:hypothetical protein